ncbi:MAG: hypothetical protein WCO44_10310 [Bacteroidota bacterium]
MKVLIFSILTAILFLFPGNLFPQDAAKLADQVYGLDQVLYNGKKYNYFLPPGTHGHQYLLTEEFMEGSVTIRGTCYQNLRLNFDILNQQLLLKYKDDAGAVNILEVSKAWLEGFSLGTMNFEYLSPEQNPRFFQVLGSGSYHILYYWRKSLDMVAAVGSSDFTFSAAVRDSYVLMNGQLRPFRNRHGLVRIFDRSHRQEIKSYLNRNKIKVHKASDAVLGDMISFIGNLK